MNILFEEQPKGTTHFFRYASGYVVWCKVEAGQNNQLILIEWDSGNECWVPGIHPVEFYQQNMGLASIDDLPTKTEVPTPESAPVGATHCYQHGGETSWYREIEENLFVWRDGSWYASTQKSARDLAKVCPFGAVTILTQEVQLAEYSKQLDWLERRPIDLSDPAGGTGGGADGAEEPNAIAQRLLTALKNDPRSFDTGVLVEVVELADAEIVKRDAAVCGGDGYLNNHWYERGELPPIDTLCELVIGEHPERCNVLAYSRKQVAIKWVANGLMDLVPLPLPKHHSFRPIRTERDRLMSILAEFDSSPGSAGRIADAILTDGFKRDGGVK